MATVKNQKTQLKSDKRKELYATKYKDILNWFRLQNQSFIEDNDFLKDMRKILETGSREFTTKMESAMKKWIYGSPKKYDPEELKIKQKHFHKHTLPKIQLVLDIVCAADKINPDKPSNVPSWSAYKFVKNVLTQTIVRNYISKPQLLALNKIFKRYNSKLPE